jgi:hypothetical protein
MATPFVVKDCTLIAIALGQEAHNLRELSDRLKSVHQGCIYYHFWGGMLRPSFDEPEYQNDFAAWAGRSLHDSRLAERLALIDPSVHQDLEDLRGELLEVIDEQLAESEYFPWARPGQRFKFIRSQIVVFATGVRISHPREMVVQIPRMSLGSIFYHFIDARRRTEQGRSDFVHWFEDFSGVDCAELIQQIDCIDPYFTTLADLQRELEAVFTRCPLTE